MKKYIFQLAMAGLLMYSVCSCSTEGVIQQILGASVEPPVFLDCRPVSATELVFTFSLPVKLVSLNFDPPIEAGSVEEGREIKVSFAQSLKEGVKMTADIIVEDSDRNSLNVIVPFRTRNDRMPAIVFNEFRFDYSGNSVEFIELKTLGPGNLGALRLFIAHQSILEPFYEFPPVEVDADKYIVLHTRTKEEGCLDETSGDSSLSKGVDAKNGAWDFWIPGNKKYLHNTNGFWLMDQDGGIIDALLVCETADLSGVTASLIKTFNAAAGFLGGQKAWLPNSGNAGEGWIPSPADAVITKGTSTTKTLCRDENIPPSPSAGNWYITALSSATPGVQNSTKRLN